MAKVNRAQEPTLRVPTGAPAPQAPASIPPAVPAPSALPAGYATMARAGASQPTAPNRPGVLPGAQPPQQPGGITLASAIPPSGGPTTINGLSLPQQTPGTRLSAGQSSAAGQSGGRGGGGPIPNSGGGQSTSGGGLQDLDALYKDILAQHDTGKETNQGLLQKQLNSGMRTANVLNARAGRGMGGGFASMTGAAQGSGMDAMARANLASDQDRRGIMMSWLDKQLDQRNRHEERQWQLGDDAERRAHEVALAEIQMSGLVPGGGKNPPPVSTTAGQRAAVAGAPPPPDGAANRVTDAVTGRQRNSRYFGIRHPRDWF